MNTTDTTHYLNFIDNQWVASDHGGAFAVDNPATDAVVATASAASAAQALLACDRAAAAQRAWRKLTSTRKGSGLNTRRLRHEVVSWLNRRPHGRLAGRAARRRRL